MMRARFPLLLLLGLVFLASVSVSFGIAYWEKENPSHNKCLQSCKSEKDSYRFQACHARCNLLKECKEDEQQEEGEHPLPPHEREHQHGEKEEDEDEHKQPRPFPFPRPHRPHHGEQEQEHKHEHEHEREQEQEHEHEQEHEKHQKEEKKETEKDEDEDEDAKESGESEGSESEKEPPRQKNKNPFYFSSNKLRTLFKNQYGHIRVLQRFNQHSPQLQNLREYRILDFKLKPNTLLLPNHADADYLIVILSGRAILSLVNNDERDSYNLQTGDALRIPSGTTYYLVNADDKENLKVITLAIPVNKPGRIESFYLSSTEAQQSYLQGFSKNILEASFDTEFEEINRVLFGEKRQQSEQSQQEGVIVEISKEQIRELKKHAISSSRKTISSEDKPFNLKSRDPIYSNKHGKFYEITPEKTPQLRDLNIFLSYVNMNEEALFLPHYNSKSTVVLVINEGDAEIELVGLKEQQKQQEEQETREVRKYRAELSEEDMFVIPAAYPVVVNATSSLTYFAFGINAENNQRNFLAGAKDNVISQLPRQVQELTFPGSAHDVDKLIKNQKDSYFVDAQPQQEEEDNKGRKVPLSSILRAFY